MSTIDYLPIANGVGANVESQAQYVTDLGSGGNLENGYQAGIARSAQINKTLRQSSMIAAAIANVISSRLSIDVLDDGNISTLIANLNTAFAGTTSIFHLTSVSGTNAITATSVESVASLQTGMIFSFTPANSNTGAATINIDSFGAKNVIISGNTLVGYEMLPRSSVLIQYDGTEFIIISGAYGGGGAPLATVRAHAASTAPAGWVLCYGQAISRTTFADLFAVIGTTYGVGDGSTTFNLPDLRGRASVGKDDMGGSAANRVTSGGSGINGTTLGANGGNQLLQSHSHTTTENPHTHGVTDSGHRHGQGNLASSGVGGATAALAGGAVTATSNDFTTTDATGVSINSASTGLSINASGGGSGQNMPPALILNYIIKA